MKYFFDTEFIEDGKTIDLISIGIVAEDGREYYAISTEFKEAKASQWVKDNVISHLPPRVAVPSMSPRLMEESLAWKSRKQIKKEILEFVYGTEKRLTLEGCLDSKIEFWACYADYDWVVFCQLFGTMMDLPEGFPMYCRDIKQWCDQLGNPKLPEQSEGKHNALSDAKWNKKDWEFLRKYEEDCTVDQS